MWNHNNVSYADNTSHAKRGILCTNVDRNTFDWAKTLKTNYTFNEKFNLEISSIVTVIATAEKIRRHWIWLIINHKTLTDRTNYEWKHGLDSRRTWAQVSLQTVFRNDSWLCTEPQNI